MRRSSAGVMIVLTLLLSLPVSAALVNRYSFTTSGPDPNLTVAVDSVSHKDGALTSAAALANDKLVLTTGYVTLPADVLSDYTSATVEAWFTLNTASGQLRIFDFGDTDAGGAGGYSWWYSPTGAGTSNLVISTGGFATWQTGEQTASAAALTASTPYHIVCVYDAAAGQMRIYQNGQLVASGSVSMLLSDVHRTFAYIGSSTYTSDPELDGSIDEFRIYNTPLYQPAVILNAEMGPDQIKTCVLTSMTPTPDTINVPISAALSWASDASITVDHYEVFVKTDPNLLDPNSVTTPAGTPDYSGALLTYTKSGLANSKIYYWRVDTVATDTTRYVGPRYKFTTVPASATIVTQPKDTASARDSAATLTLTGTGITSYAWYKVGTPDQLLTNNGTYSGTTTGTLTISNMQVTEEGKYYCIVTGLPGTTPLTVTSNTVYLWAKRLMGLWKLENNMLDSVATEVSGAPAHDGTFVAGTGGVETYGTGILGNGMVFAGSSGTHVDIASAAADSAFFNFYTKGLTVNIWYKGTATAWRLPVTKLQVGVTGWLFGINSNGTAAWIFETKGGLNTSVTVSNGSWHMITGTYDADGKLRKTYVDGINVTSGALDLSAYAYATNTLPVNIGGRITESAITATVDEVRVYSYPLSANEVAQLYYQDRGNTPFCQTKPAYDFNNDCKENLADFAYIAASWLECGYYPAAGNCP